MSQISKKTVKRVKDQAKQVAIEENKISEEETKILEEAFAQAKMPVEMTDEDFKCGEYELDIRKLSPENRQQMIFRALTLNVVYLRQTSQNQIDIMRLLMLVLKKLGVEDVEKDLASLMEELTTKTQSIKN